MNLVQDSSINRNRCHLPRNEFSTCLQGIFYGVLDTAAARNLHADNGHALDVVAADDFGQLFGVVDAVKLWTSAQSYFTMDKVLMEAAVCVSGTVGSDQKFGIVEIRGADRG